MSSTSTTPQRPDLERILTWPPTTSLFTDESVPHMSESGSMSAATENKQRFPHFEDNIEDHPESHFHSPMYDYEEWDSDDDDGEEVEWNAGITDFALFDDDRKRAQENDEALPSRWASFVSSQEAAMQRALQRERRDYAPDTTRPPLPFEDLPGLTPDSSPRLKDDLDAEASGDVQPSKPSYVTITVTPPPEDQRAIDEDDDLPLTFHYQRPSERKQAKHKVQRPGLTHNRTLSGKVHVWRRPSWHIYPVREDAEAEGEAETAFEEEQIDGDAEVDGQR